MRVLLVGSSGGHLSQLLMLRSWWADGPRRWVTFDLPDAAMKLEGEEVAWAAHPTTRNIPNLLRNCRIAFRELRHYKPDVVISTGAGVALPFFWLARFMGVTTVYLEVYDRVDTRTMTGRMCRPVTDLFLVQWQEQLSLYPGATLLGRLW